MKKVLFIAIAGVVFTACQKEQKPLIAIPQKEDITTELAAMKTKITKSDMVTVVDQTTSGFRCTKPPVTCSPIPVALGA